MEEGSKGFFAGLVVGVLGTVAFLNMPTNDFIQLYVYGVCAAIIMSIISATAGAVANARCHNQNHLNKNNQTTPLKEFQKRSIDRKMLTLIILFSWISVAGLILLSIKDAILKKPPVKMTFE